MADRDVLLRYRVVVEAFLAGRLTPRVFSDEVWELFKRDRDAEVAVDWGDDHEMLNMLVLAAEAYEEDAPIAIGEAELRTAAEHAAAQLDTALRRPA